MVIFAIRIKKIYIFAASKRGIDQWCNGSTTGFGSVSLGSSPGWSTNNKNDDKVG